MPNNSIIENCIIADMKSNEDMKSFNESIKGNNSVSNPYDDSNWDGE